MGRIFFEPRDLADDQGDLIELLGGDEAGGLPGECVPAMDVLETTAAVEILMDLPGVAIDSVKILFVRGALVVVGQKLPPTCEHREAAFHLAERAFGRFARAVRLSGAFDVAHATATVQAGELRVVLRRIEDRRGREIRIPITPA